MPEVAVFFSQPVREVSRDVAATPPTALRIFLLGTFLAIMFLL
jgi:hypothetical protein